MLKGRSAARQSVRYLLVGIASALIEYLLFVGLHQLIALSIPFANALALTCSTLFNFLLNKTWTFELKGRLGRSMTLYLLLFIFNVCITSAMIVWLGTVGVTALLAKPITMACAVTWNFFLYRHVIFVDKASH